MNESQAAAAVAGVMAVVFFMVAAVWVFSAIVGWKIFAKAGKPGWAALIPIYNAIVFLQIVGRPWWWLLLCLIPIVNLVISILLAIDLAKSFGKDVAFAVGLFLLGIVFYPILAFGSATYQGPAAKQA